MTLSPFIVQLYWSQVQVPVPAPESMPLLLPVQTCRCLDMTKKLLIPTKNQLDAYVLTVADIFWNLWCVLMSGWQLKWERFEIFHE
jgi:hypothetical protein